MLGDRWNETLHNGTGVHGVATKIAKDEGGLINDALLRILAYSLVDDRVWYSLEQR